MKKKIAIGALILNLGVNILYANVNLNKNYIEPLYSCMVKKITNEQRKYIKEYGFLSFAYPDKVINKLLKVNKKQVKDITTKASQSFTDLLVNKCKEETKALFLNNSLQKAYFDIAQVINRITAYAFNNSNDINFNKRKEIKEWLKKELKANETLKNFIHNVYFLKTKKVKQ